MAWGYGQAAPKPAPRKRTTARKQRHEAAVKKSVRAQCVERDGYCRVSDSQCGGLSEWAHLGAKKRARTRGMAPELRHTTGGSLMLCTVHHLWYDRGQMQIVPLTLKGADGLLHFRPVVIA